jgi:Fur family ferric uptake transcriptional regulator
VPAESEASVSSSTVRERSTRPFAAVRDELAKGDDFRSAQDIHAALRGNGAKVGLATVYRALQSLADSGEADVLRTASGEAVVYRACGTGHHHHHLVCRSCGKTVEVQGPAVERWADKTAREYGFADLSHTVELFGICAACQERLK